MASFTACFQRRDLYLAMATGHMADCKVSSYRLFKFEVSEILFTRRLSACGSGNNAVHEIRL